MRASPPSQMKWIPAAILSACAALALSARFVSSDERPRPAWECKGIFARQSGPSAIPENSIARYQIRLTNEGDCALDDGTLTDYIPRRSIYRAADPQPNQEPESGGRLPVQQILWKEIDLAPAGDEILFTVEMEIQGPSGRTATNTACFEHPRAGRICSEFETYVKPRD